MAKKSKAAKVGLTKKRKHSVLDLLPKSHEEYLELLIKKSEEQISGAGSSIDEFFTYQAEKIKKQLKELRKK